MSNRLANIAKRITSLAGRRIHASEKGVLLALADDARDHLGGRSKLTNRQLQQITGFSERAVRMAITALADAGHITREAGEPGAPIITLVHPSQCVAAPAAIAPPGAAIAPPPGNGCRGSYREENNYQDTSPEDHGTHGRAREPAAADPVDEVEQVFAAWNAFQQRAGLPPVASVMARRAAVAARLADHGLGSTLMVIDKTERALRERRAPKGQGDLFFRFDMVFGVGNLAEYIVFERMLEGQFDPPTPPPAAAPPRAELPAIMLGRANEGDEERKVRRMVKDDVGDHAYDAWILHAVLSIDGDALRVGTPSAFAADWVKSHHGDALRRAASRVTGGRVHRVETFAARATAERIDA